MVTRILTKGLGHKMPLNQDAVLLHISSDLGLKPTPQPVSSRVVIRLGPAGISYPPPRNGKLARLVSNSLGSYNREAQ